MDKKIFKVIALDLDGTLLDSKSKLTDDNRRALELAHEMGAFIVPCTGRLYGTMPDEIRDLSCVRYVIEANGARIYDAIEDRIVAESLLDIDYAMTIYDWLDGIDCIYDCYTDGQAYVERSFYKAADVYCAPCYGAPFYWRTRTPVDGFKDFVRRQGIALQKISVFFKTPEEKLPVMDMLKERFDRVAVSTSLVNNIEINALKATKGSALKALCSYLGIDISDSIAFGDALNDVDLVAAAGCGVAMGNSHPAVLEAADMVTLSNDESGVSAALHKLMLP